jgi:hypothetical protein
MEYLVQRLAAEPTGCDWDSPIWKSITPLAIDQFHPRSSDHHPIVHAKVGHTGNAVHAIYRVQDRYVKSVGVNFQDMVCLDSCVEFFIQPKKDRGYFNFEFNCGGTMLVWCIEEVTPGDGEIKKRQPVTPQDAELVRITTTLPKTTPIEITKPIEWRLQCTIPVAVLEHYIGPLGDLAGQHWRANLFKCADKSSHPHWASWSPIGEVLRFHQPDKFGEFRFQ